MAQAASHTTPTIRPTAAPFSFADTLMLAALPADHPAVLHFNQRREQEDACRPAAMLLVAQLTKNAARRYRSNPALLETITNGLSLAKPSAIIAIVESMQKRAVMPKDIGFGGMVTPINLRGARLYGRYRRRHVPTDVIERVIADHRGIA